MGRVLYLHGFASGPGSRKAEFFRERLGECGVGLEVLELDGGDFEKLTVSGQLEAVERAAGGEGVDLIGSSMGGYVAALYAARHPEARRLVLLAPAFAFGRRWQEMLGPQAMEEWRRSGWLEVYHYGERRMRRVWYGLAEDTAQYEEYPDARQPALILHGARDEVVPVEHARRFAADHPGARLEVLESGHELLDVLETVWERSREFLLGPAGVV